jgi:hypothetical protein
MPMTIDMTPTWGEVGLFVRRLVFSNEEKALQHIWPEVARAFASAQALNAVLSNLSQEQQDVVSRIMDEELRKQGFEPTKKGGVL